MEDIHDKYIKPQYKSSLPYPEIKVVAPNSYYAELLMDDYAGIVSELTATNQYMYHYFVINERYSELKTMLENIAIVEMKHLEMLAELITLLGGNPIYRGSTSTQTMYWSGSFVFYGKDVCEELEADLKSEYDAIENYRQDINMINDPYIKDILNRIILDEELHAKLFKDAINKYCKK